MAHSLVSADKEVPTGVVLVGGDHGFVPLFPAVDSASSAASEADEPERSERLEALRQAESDRQIRLAEKSGMEKAQAAARLVAQAEMEKLTIDVTARLEGVVDQAVKALAQQAQDAVGRCEMTMAHLIRQLLGDDRANLCSAALLSQMRAVLNAAISEQPATISLSQEDLTFVGTRVPGFAQLCKRHGIAIETDDQLKSHAGRVVRLEGTTVVDIGGFVEQVIATLADAPASATKSDEA